MKTFDFEAFKAGQKALTRDGRVARFIGVCEECCGLHYVIIHIEGGKHTSAVQKSGTFFETAISAIDLVSMVSRHQHLIDAYNPDDTWQVHTKQSGTWVTIKEPTWDEDYEWRLHPHNDLIKAYKKGAKIECKHKDKEWRDASSDDIRSWCEDAEYRIKPEPTIHCLCYNPGHVHGEFSWSPSLATKELAVANGWTIIKEWEV